MDETFDIRNFSGTMQEIMIFHINQMGDVNTSDHFWKAQKAVQELRAKLERVYKSTAQKAARSGKRELELWQFGCAAYFLITEEGRRIGDVTKLSGPKLRNAAVKYSSPMLEASSQMLQAWVDAGRPEDEMLVWQQPFMIEKKSREHGEEE